MCLLFFFPSNTSESQDSLLINICINAWPSKCKAKAWHGRCTFNATPPGPFCGIHQKGCPRGIWSSPATRPLSADQQRMVNSWKAKAQEAAVKEELGDEEEQGDMEAGLSEFPEELLTDEEKDEEGEEGVCEYPEEWLPDKEGDEGGEEEVAKEEKDEQPRTPIKQEKVKEEPQDQENVEEQQEGATEPATKARKLDKDTMARLQAEAAHDGGKDTKLAVEYSAFCVANPGLPKIKGTGKLTSTPLGKMFLSEQGALNFLKVLQEDGNLSAKYTLGKFGLLKKGIRAADLPAASLPAWAVSGTRVPPVIDKWLKDLDAAQKKEKAKSPAVEKPFMTFEQVDNHCIKQVIAIKCAPSYDICDIVGALLMRLISSRSVRTINTSKITWADVGLSGSGAADAREAEPYLDVSVTKNVRRLPTARALAAQSTSRLTLTDAVSKELFFTWWEYAPADVKSSPDCFFFPEFGKDGFLWERAMSNETSNLIVRGCALAMGLVRNDAHLMAFTSTSVRQGTAADTYKAVGEYISARNKDLGRASSSDMELGTYVPPQVVMAPGPLLSQDVVAMSDQALCASLASAAEEHKWQLLCCTCGFPHCDCAKCKACADPEKTLSAIKKMDHGCWLGAFAHKKGKRSRKFTWETGEQFQIRLQAWTDIGLQDVPTFKDGYYTFEQ